MKKIFCFIMAAVVIVLSVMSPVYAYGQNKGTPPGLQKKGGLPPGLMKKFNDLTNYEWAQEAIEEMALKGIIQGIGDGKYAPSSSVTKIQALAMIIRTMGWDEEAEDNLELILKGKLKDKLKDRLEDWGKGYIEVALEKGLIDEVDVAQQNFTTPASRQDVAKYIIRALGKEEEAQEYMDVELRFKDAAAVQVGAVGYVYLVDKLEIMVGDNNNNFQPNKPMTRAEIAVLMKNLDELDEDDDDQDVRQITGEIYKLYSEEIQIKTDNSVKTYDVTDDTKVYDIDGDRISYSEMEKGMTVRLSVEDGDVVTIRVLTDEDDDIDADYEGLVKAVGDNTIKLQVSNMLISFNVLSSADIEINGVDKDLDDIQVGDEAKITVDSNNRVKEIYVTRTVNDQTFEGVITKLDTNSDKVTIKVGSVERTYTMDDDADIRLDGRATILRNLLVGMKVEARIKNQQVIRLYAESITNTYEGKLTAVEFGAQNKLTIGLTNGSKTFVIDGDAKIFDDDDAINVADLVEFVGEQVEIKVINYKIVRIEIL
ncbi:MAG: S-layer homology domain-containing protein [Bacillota bacterium]